MDSLLTEVGELGGVTCRLYLLEVGTFREMVDEEEDEGEEVGWMMFILIGRMMFGGVDELSLLGEFVLFILWYR